MFRKIFGLLLLGYLSPSMAFSKSACLDLLITIENKTKSNCALIQKDLYNGVMKSADSFFQIDVGESKKIHITEWETLFRGGPTLTLSYMCGNGMITIATHKDACIYGGEIHATITSIADMNTSFSTENASLLKGTKGSIIWTFEQT